MKKFILMMLVLVCGVTISAQDKTTDEATKVVKEKVEKVVTDVEEKVVPTKVEKAVESAETKPMEEAVKPMKGEAAVKEKTMAEDPVEEIIEDEDDDK